MASIDLTTLATVKTELGPSVTNVTGPNLVALESMLSGIITSASRVIMTQTGRRFKSAEVTKVFNGDATYGLGLPNGPVTDVTSVTIDGNSIPPIEAVGDAGWVLRNDRVELVGYVFSTGVANVQVTYTSGFDPVPEDIERACIELSVWMYQNRNHVGLQQRSVHDADAVTFRKDEWPYNVQVTVESYRTFMGITPFAGVEE